MVKIKSTTEENTMPHTIVDDTQIVQDTPIGKNLTIEEIETTPLDSINNLLESCAALKNLAIDLKNLKKEYIAWEKITNKGKKKQKQDPNKIRQPSGITKPTEISEELANFLGLEIDGLYPRVEITSRIHKYADAHNLKDVSDRRNIDLSSPHGKELKKLLRIEEELEVLNMFQIQKYLKCHFPLSKAAKSIIEAEKSEEVEAKSEPEPEAKSEPEPEVEAKSEPEPEAKSEPEPEPELEAKSEPESTPKVGKTTRLRRHGVRAVR